MRGYLSVFQVFTALLVEKFRPRYDVRLQLMAYQIKMLRDRIDDGKIYTRPEERAELLRLGALLDHDIADVMLVVKPRTYRSWMKPKEAKPRRPGRPGTAKATTDLVLRFALENLGWGYKRLHGELKKLGIRIGLTTIFDILKREGIHPVPDKGRRKPSSTWKHFISSHMETLVACDFFSKPVLTWRGWVDAYVLVFIHLGSRRVFMTPATFNPTEDWVLQQARNTSMWLQDLGIQASHLIRDRDTKFTVRFDQFWKNSGTHITKTPVRTPQANGYAESCIGTFKKQCLDHFACFSLDHLNYINHEWVAYYNTERPHQGADIGNKVLRPKLCPASQWHPVGTRHSARFPFASQAVITPTDKGEIKREQRLGGVISWYYRDAA